MRGLIRGLVHGFIFNSSYLSTSHVNTHKRNTFNNSNMTRSSLTLWTGNEWSKRILLHCDNRWKPATRPDFFDSNLTIYPALQIRGVDVRAGPNRKGLFHYRAGSGRVLKKSWVAGRFGSCRSVEIFDRVYIWVPYFHSSISG